jgi:head-tail adaptor
VSTPNLDRRVDIQRPVPSQSGSGAVTETWGNLVALLPAAYRALKGEERNTAPQWVASQQVEFTIRWRLDLASLNPKDRVIYPALNPDLSPEDEITQDRVFDIIDAAERGRREWVVIRAARFADTVAT